VANRQQKHRKTSVQKEHGKITHIKLLLVVGDVKLKKKPSNVKRNKSESAKSVFLVEKNEWGSHSLA